MRLKLFNEQMPPPFPRLGGKGATAGWYRDLLPPHRTYVEAYCGSAALLFSKPRSKVEVINDLDSDLFNFFLTVRDPEKCAALADAVEKTPYSRNEFARCKELEATVTEPVERARIFFVLSRQAFGSVTGITWAYGRSSMKSFHQAISLFEPVCQRLQRVQIENLPALTVIDKYDTFRTVFFIDPPYLPSTRIRQTGYRYEMDEEDHRELLARLTTIKGKVMLCGYPSELYDEMLPGWRKVERAERCRTGGLRDGQAERPDRIEAVWMNYRDPGTK
jgi:DNA adenine methylase